MSSAPTPQEIAADAGWLAQALDLNAGLVRLVRMSREDYRAASFLDDRLLQTAREQHVIPWNAAVSGLGADARDDATWIFHIGHVGSTLLSRLLGELPDLLSVREPRLLRDLALAGAASFVPATRQLMARSFAPHERALVKATSFVSEIAAQLIGDNPAIFMFAGPRTYLGTILAGENSLIELATLASARRQRMQDRATLPHYPDRPAFNAAAAWACEMTALEAAAARLGPDSILWLDFDLLLRDTAGRLGEAAQFLGIAADPRHVGAIANGPLMKRYSKALEYDYTPALRAELIAEATARHAADVVAALAMLSAAAQESPLLARALERAKAER